MTNFKLRVRTRRSSADSDYGVSVPDESPSDLTEVSFFERPCLLLLRYGRKRTFYLEHRCETEAH